MSSYQLNDSIFNETLRNYYKSPMLIDSVETKKMSAIHISQVENGFMVDVQGQIFSERHVFESPASLAKFAKTWADSITKEKKERQQAKAKTQKQAKK